MRNSSNVRDTYAYKYNRYLTKKETRFAEDDEMRAVSEAAFAADNKAAGVPLYYEDGSLFVDNEDNHSLIIGPTGCKKSRVTAFSALASIIEAGESAIVNDPKGELYRKTGARARELGAKVHVLNFRKPAASYGWNPLSQAKRFWNCGKKEEAMQFLSDFSETVVSPALERTNDIYWGETTKMFLNGILLTLVESLPIEVFNMKTLLPFCYAENCGWLKGAMEKMDPASPAVFGLRAVLDLEAERTKSCVYSTLMMVLRPLAQNSALLDMLSSATKNMEKIGTEQTVVYIIYPDEKQSLNFLVNLFLTQSYETLVSVAADQKDDKLPVRVNYVLDEFSNLTTISNFANRISEARSKQIRYHLFIQSFSQLKKKYGDEAETIRSNCGNWICFSSKEMEFLGAVSAICGNDVDYRGVSHPLMSPFEMQHLRKSREGAEVLIIKQGQYPFVCKLPDFDVLKISRQYRPCPLSEAGVPRVVKSVLPDEWAKRVNEAVYKFPFPKSRAAS